MLHISPIAQTPKGIAALQKLLESAPKYSKIATGDRFSEAAAQSLFDALPPGKKYSDKFVLGAHLNGQLIGCVDLIRGYPSEEIAYIGLLLISEDLESNGYGTELFNHICRCAMHWNTCTRLKLGVLETNHRAARFWLKLGFKPTGESKSYDFGTVSTRVIQYERALPAEA